MKEQQRFSVSKRLKSFKYAFNGLQILFKEEHNARVHLLVAICVIAAGLFFNLSTNEWLAIVFSIGLVFSLEIVNSSIENIADFISPEKHEMIKKVKDLSAAGVLVGAITALIIGAMIFCPKILIC